MTDPSIRFADGAAYERMMGAWSALAGGIFLDWLKPRQKLAWVDVGCGNGAFTELIVQRLAPAEVDGVDPSDGQLSFARSRPGTKMARFHKGDAMALPFNNGAFDAAVMALVIFFVPEPAKGVAEMARVVAPGGIVAAYAWDMDGGGFPLQPVMTELRAMGLAPQGPPSPDASRVAALQKLWGDAGLLDIETRRIDVTRRFSNFDEFWDVTTLGSTVRPTIAAMAPDVVAKLKARVRGYVTEAADGSVSYDAFANAVKGKVAG
jgi:SAM-dependent methyltransferase